MKNITNKDTKGILVFTFLYSIFLSIQNVCALSFVLYAEVSHIYKM